MLGPEDRGGFGALSLVGDVAPPIRPFVHIRPKMRVVAITPRLYGHNFF